MRKKVDTYGTVYMASKDSLKALLVRTYTVQSFLGFKKVNLNASKAEMKKASDLLVCSVLRSSTVKLARASGEYRKGIEETAAFRRVDNS